MMSRWRIQIGSRGCRRQTRRHWASPEMWVTCALGPYNFEFMTEVRKEIMSRYRVDGIFINRWDGSVCAIASTAERISKQPADWIFRARTTLMIHRAECYILWRQQRLFDLWQLWDSEVLRDQPRLQGHSKYRGRSDQLARHETNRRTGAHTDCRPPGAARADGAVGEREERERISRHHGPQADCRHLQRRPRGALSLEGFSAEPGGDSALGCRRGCQRLRPWFTEFSGTLHDERWLKPVEEIYRVTQAGRNIYEMSAAGRVGLVYSQQTAWFYGQDRFERAWSLH